MPKLTKTPLMLRTGCRLFQGLNHLIFIYKDNCLKIHVPKSFLCLKKKTFFHVRFLTTKRYSSVFSFYSCLKHSLKGLFFPYLSILKLKGIGFKLTIDDKNLLFNLGYSHPIFLKLPQGVSLKVLKKTQLFIRSSSKDLLNTFCMKLNHLKKKDPYKGKGLIIEGKEPLLKIGKRA